MTSKLPIATEGPCKGHPCDNCATCRRGRCCRRDNPDYKLPGFGEWDGPIWGKPGVLDENEQGVECHCCGGRYKQLGHHTIVAHDLTAAEYKSIFGFSRHFGLLSKSSSQKHREASIAAGCGWESPPELSAEQRSDYASRSKRLSGKIRISETKKASYASGKTVARPTAWKLTTAQVLEIRNANPTTRRAQLDYARKFGVAEETIRRVVIGESWKSISTNDRTAA